VSDDFHTHPKPGTFTHYPTDFERLEVAEAHIKRLTAENQYQANLLGNAYGAIADWTDLPSDTRPAKAIEHLGREVERLTAELAGEEAVIDHWLKVAGKYKTYWEAAEAREKKLRDVLNEAFRTETVRDLHDWLERAKKGTVA